MASALYIHEKCDIYYYFMLGLSKIFIDEKTTLTI